LLKNPREPFLFVQGLPGDGVSQGNLVDKATPQTTPCPRRRPMLGGSGFQPRLGVWWQGWSAPPEAGKSAKAHSRGNTQAQPAARQAGKEVK